MFHMISKFFCFLTTIFFSLSLLAQNEDSVIIKKIADDVMQHGQAYDNLRFLCKKIGARLSGSAHAQKAVEATSRMLKEAGVDTVYLQPCLATHWVRGAKEKGTITLANGVKRKLHLCALGNSVGSGGKMITSSVIEVKNFKELEQLGKSAIKGKIIFFNFPMNQTYIETGRAYGESGPSRTRGATMAAKYGAIAVMVRSLSTNLDDNPHTGVTYYNDSFPKIPAVAISTNDAEWLSLQLKKRIQLSAGIQTNCQLFPPTPSFNVVGEIRGNQFPSAIITVGGHLDSWDLGEGAHDDGADIVQSIEVLRAFKASSIQPKRTIRAVMFMDEENGGVGADKYLALAQEKKEQHIFGLESDGGGFAPRGFSFEITDSLLQKVKQWQPLFYPYGVYELKKGGSGADVGPLRVLGATVVGLHVDGQRYFDLHHAATDVFENVNKRELHLGALNMAALIYLVDKYGL